MGSSINYVITWGGGSAKWEEWGKDGNVIYGQACLKNFKQIVKIGETWRQI